MWLLLLLPVLVTSLTRELVYLGQIYQKSLSQKSTVTGEFSKKLPSWLVMKNGILYGIPGKEDVGSHVIKISSTSKEEQIINLIVKEDTSNPCGDEDSYWVEALYEENKPIENRIDAALDIATALEVNVTELKVYSYNYSRTFRKVDAIGGDATAAFTVMKKVACGDDLDTAASEMDTFLSAVENVEYDYIVLTKGRVLRPINNATSTVEKITTVTEIATLRTTRKVDNPPVKLNSLSAFTCARGVYCEVIVPESTFKDVEDGDTFKLKLSVQSIDKEDSWIMYEHKKLKGVPLEEGDHEFRLEARDKAGQMASAPFKVSVTPSFPFNHLVMLELDTSIAHFLKPSSLSAFVRRLAHAFRSTPDAVTIRNITGNGGKTIVTWSNNTVPHKICDHRALDNIRHTMLTKQRAQTKIEFVKSVGSQFHVRKAALEFAGNCVEKESEPVSTAPTVEARDLDAFPWLIFFGVLILLILLCIVICAICNAIRKSKKKEKPSDYMSKGMPVVFPEEVAEDFEMAHAATPMLTKEERPPLKVSQHENPLYKPPPPLAAASPRIGTTATVPNQRMPPTYVPP
ncbi:hypothetical protein KIN20_000329 [Parelaphostrongylus tenuis]|uniref:Dystroglycan 1 n=1 Tax=Parelaphostrongylus tenuis TaxID=148309 RepID=A0AAD5QBF3_PARTN|nr:hypothetical protein KIN20_000329 [Parelaphostrongylus tenuis]